MGPNREGILAGLAGFLIGVLFTLVVHEFASSAIGGIERRLILLVLLILASAVLAFYLKFKGAAALASGSRTVSGADWEGQQDQPPTQLKPSNAKHAAPPPSRREDAALRRVSGEPLKQPEVRPGPGAVRSTSTPTPRPQYMSTAPEPSFYENSEPFAPGYSNNTSAVMSLGSCAGADRLPEIWESYFRNGDGKFNSTGLKRQLEAAGISADVIPGEHLSLGDSLLGVDFRDKSGLLYLLPNFSKPARAVESWFQTIGTGSRLARIQRLIRPATARRKGGGGLILEAKGEVE